MYQETMSPSYIVTIASDRQIPKRRAQVQWLGTIVGNVTDVTVAAAWAMCTAEPYTTS